MIPVRLAGVAPGPLLLARVGPEIIVPADIESWVGGTRVGATISFIGTVRDHDHGREVEWLTYEAHPDAAAMLESLVADFAGEHEELLAVAAAHRTGDLEIGDVAFVACVSAPHRGRAFAACAELVERVKHSLPVWKLQRFADGEQEWVNAL